MKTCARNWIRLVAHGARPQRLAARFHWRYFAAALGMLAIFHPLTLRGQSPEPVSAPPPEHTILRPEANRLPDVNDQMEMREQLTKKKNFDAANALRTKQIADDTIKLLILTRDLKAKLDKLGNDPLTPELIRETEVIAILAHDVQKKMKLTVGSS